MGGCPHLPSWISSIMPQALAHESTTTVDSIAYGDSCVGYSWCVKRPLMAHHILELTIMTMTEKRSAAQLTEYNAKIEDYN